MVEPVLATAPRERPLPDDERRCTATARDGQRCRAYRARGHETCAGHAGLGFNRDPDSAREAGKRGGHARAKVLAAARHEVRLRSVATPRELMTAGFAARVADGATLRAIDAALASPDPRVALQAAEVVHDRLFGRPVALTETQLPGTQAYVELRRTLDSLEPEERLAYLRESRMAAGIALTQGEAAVQGVAPTSTRPRPRACAGGGRGCGGGRGGGDRGVGLGADVAARAHVCRGRRQTRGHPPASTRAVGSLPGTTRDADAHRFPFVAFCV